MTVDQLASYVKQYWPTIKARLLAGKYPPQGVRAVDIPNPKGGTRQLGIPSVVDLLIQQALLQQLMPIFDPLFSYYSYGFRPGRSAHHSIKTARAPVAAGPSFCGLCRRRQHLCVQSLCERASDGAMLSAS